jgi:hypothetical protein
MSCVPVRTPPTGHLCPARWPALGSGRVGRAGGAVDQRGRVVGRINLAMTLRATRRTGIGADSGGHMTSFWLRWLQEGTRLRTTQQERFE